MNLTPIKSAIWAILIVTALLYSLSQVAFYYFKSRRGKNFPPGPKPLPFIGNLHIFPPTKGFLKFHELGKQYGSIIGLKLGPQNVVILNDYKHVQELFDKRGGIYSSRPPNHIANDLIFQDETHILFQPYGNGWRKLRKTLQDLLKISTVDTMLPIQNAEATATLFQLLKRPEDWYDHIRRYSTAVILAGVFGLRGAEFGSPRVRRLYHVQDQMTKITEIGATPPVDIFPFLKHLPDFMSPWRKWARNIRKEYREQLFDLVRESKQQMQSADSTRCFLQRLYEMAPKEELDDEHVAYQAGVMMEAGSDTTASTLLSFLLAMVKHPDVLAACQKEVDELCGATRTPVIEDLESLPYLHAVMNETLRWRPVAAGGIPHALTQDDWYEGYFFPKGTIFFANAWAIHRTEEFASPESFKPERFLNNKFGIQSPADDNEKSKRRVQYGFGGGRRVCPGQHLAENSLVMNMAKLVWAFDFKADPHTIDDSVAEGYYGGFLIAPKKFPLRIAPRSSEHAAVIEKEYQAELSFLARFKE